MGHYYAEMFPDGEKDRHCYTGNKVREELPFVTFIKNKIEREMRELEAVMNMDGDGI